MSIIDEMRSAGFDDDTIGSWANEQKPAMKQAGFDDATIDGYFSGLKQPGTIPRPFLKRASSWLNSTSISDAATEGAKAMFGEAPIGPTPEDTAKLRAMGVYDNGTGNAAVRGLRLANETLVPAVATSAELMFRGFNGALGAIGAVGGQLAYDTGLSGLMSQGKIDDGGERSRRDMAHFVTIGALLAGTVSPVSRAPKTLGAPDEIIGHLPLAKDFTATAKIVAEEARSNGTTIKPVEADAIKPELPLNDGRATVGEEAVAAALTPEERVKADQELRAQVYDKVAESVPTPEATPDIISYELPHDEDYRFGKTGKVAFRQISEAATRSQGMFEAQFPEGSAGKFVALRSGETGVSGTLAESGVWIDKPSKPRLFDTREEAEAATRQNLGIAEAAPEAHDPVPAMARQKIVTLYEEHGIHPAEIAADIKSDPEIARAIMSDDPNELPKAYVESNPPVAQEEAPATAAPAAAPANPVATELAAADAITTGTKAIPEYSPDNITPPAKGESAGYYMFKADKLNVDAKRFQFKSDGDAQGVNKALSGVTQWDRSKSGGVIVWQQKDGQFFVADGHQRTGLARRLMSAGHAPIEIPGVLYREIDGVTAEHARAVAAAANIANGSGSALDGAKVLRSRPDLIDGSIPLSTGKGKQAVALSKLDDEAFGLVVNEVVPENYGAIVGELIPRDGARQVAALKAIARFEPRNVDEAAALVNRVKAAELAKADQGAQGSMFGDLETAESTAGEEMKIVGRAIADLKKDKTLFGRVVANAERIEQTGSKIEQENAKSVATDAEKFARILASDAYSAGPIRDVLVAAARDLKNGHETIGDSAARVVAALRGGTEKVLAKGDGAGGSAKPAKGTEGRGSGDGPTEPAPGTYHKPIEEAGTGFTPEPHSRTMETALDKIEEAVEAKDRDGVKAAAAAARKVLKDVPDSVKAEDAEYWGQFKSVINKMTKPDYVTGKQAYEAERRVAKPSNTIEFTDWKDVGGGYSIRESTTHPIQEIRTAEGNILTRGLDTNGKEYQEFEMGHNPLGKGGMAWVDKALAELQARAGQPKLERPTEPGADGKPQGLIPGVEPVKPQTPREQIIAAAEKPMTGGDAPADGLFGNSMNEPELFDKPRNIFTDAADRAAGQDLLDGPEGGKPKGLGADAVDPYEETPRNLLPAGSLVAALRNAASRATDIWHDIQMNTAPMALGTDATRAVAKDFANALRRVVYEWSRIDDTLVKNFSREDRARMWSASDEESVALQLGESREHQGLVTLDDRMRAVVEALQTRAQSVWVQARDLGMVKGEGLPSYTPRMLINIATGSGHGPRALNAIGTNLKTTSNRLKHRAHMMDYETERAARDRFGEEVELARDIRALPLATADLERAVTGRQMIENIKEIGKRAGNETVAEGAKPLDGQHWFTIDHPAFKTWRPKLEYKPTGELELEGNMAKTVKDADGNVIFEQVPLYVHGDFEGPLRAVLGQRSGKFYSAAMELKGKTMSVIMNSPMIHNAVEFGRAFATMPGKMLTFRVYRDGGRAIADITTMREAIDHGLVPIGHRAFNQDITSMMEAPELKAGRSTTSQVLAYVPGLFDPAAGLAVKQAIDTAGNFWHNTLLWDQVAKLQAGLYVNIRDAMTTKGIDATTAQYMAAHMANRYAGALPKEAMSHGATAIANSLLFSRSFTMGNLGVMKDMLNGMPRDVMAQIQRDVGSIDPKAAGFARSMARRKAISIVVADAGLFLVVNSLLASAINVMSGRKDVPEEMQGYADRMQKLMHRVSDDPTTVLHPLAMAESLTPMSENEPGKQDRILMGHSKDGTAIYLRNPIGKIGEEFISWFGSPLEMLKKKEGTVFRPLFQTLANDKGFGRKVYNPYAEDYADIAKVGVAIATHIAKAQTPEGQLNALYDLARGQGDSSVNAAQAFGPLLGLTSSRGAPGGPAQGELYHQQAVQRFRVDAKLPEWRQRIQNGEGIAVIGEMTQMGVPKGLQQFYLRTSMNPSSRMTARAMKDFYLSATPEQRARMEDALKRQQASQQ